MRTFLLFLALLLPGFAFAELPACIPSVYGVQVGELYAVRTDEGRFMHWYCLDGTFVKPVGISCVHGTCLPVGTFFDNVDTLRRQPDPVAAIKSAWANTFDNAQCNANATGAFKTVCGQMYASMWKNWPK